MQLSEPKGTNGPVYASVPTDPIRARGLTGRDPWASLEQAARGAREAGDAAGAARAYAACSDFHLQGGQVRQARSTLLQAMVQAHELDDASLALTLERRDAWLGHLSGEADAGSRISLLRQRADALGDGFELAVCSMYLALIEAREGRNDHVHPLVSGALDYLRQTADPGTLARMALLAATAYHAAGHEDHALVEVLRVRLRAHEDGDEELELATDSVLELLRGSTADERVHRLIAVAIEVGRQRDLREILETVVHAVLDLVKADRAFVVRARPDDTYQLVARTSRSGHAGEPSSSVVRRVLREGREVITRDLGHAEGLSAAKSIVSLGLQTALCVPLMDGPRIIGAIYADSATTPREELDSAAWLVRAFAAHVVTAIRNAEHRRDIERRHLMSREVNHDVRNLVGSLRMGLGELAEDAGLEPWAQDLVAQLQDISSLIQRQVSQALHERRPEPEPVAMGDLVQRVCAFVRFECAKRGVRVVTAIEDATVFAREDDLTRVVSNLLDNALKYSPDDAPIQVSLQSIEDEAVLRVVDAGEGIPTESLAHIFDSGVQAEGHRSGHGLGLGICRKLVSQAGGTIRAYNDGGAAFEVRLPRLP